MKSLADIRGALEREKRELADLDEEIKELEKETCTSYLEECYDQQLAIQGYIAALYWVIGEDPEDYLDTK